jgi:hypothetical protein
MDPRTERAVRTYVNYKLMPGYLLAAIAIGAFVGPILLFGLKYLFHFLRLLLAGGIR